MKEPRWKTITPSEYEWERSALDFLRERLPDHEPYRAWSNFEFQTPVGAIYECDLLVLTKAGFWLVEIKSFPGDLRGDTTTWTITHDGRTRSIENPLLLTNRKAKALSSLLKRQKSAKKIAFPFLEAVVFLSSEQLNCQLDELGRNRIFLRDVENKHGDDRPGIREALVNRRGAGLREYPSSRIDTKVAKALVHAVDEAGIRHSPKARKVGDYELRDLLEEGPGYQEWFAEHATLKGIYSRVRQYLVADAANEEERRRLQRAAVREFKTLQNLDHPGILSVRDYKDAERGPAVLFHYEKDAVRFDHFIAARWGDLTIDQKLDLFRQLVFAVRFVHGKKVVHRSLSPQSIVVFHPDSKEPQLKIAHWQLAVRQDGGTAHATASGTTTVDALVEAQSMVFLAPECRSVRDVTEAADVFSLGALAYLLFAGRPPAMNATALAKKLHDDQGLKLSAALDGVGAELEEMVREAT
ncbi:MAG: NERD domain-containing protein, partial [Planctomycetes bacterium]|nr:NERD domain-containing protein [Planctomycetota bacterium]